MSGEKADEPCDSTARAQNSVLAVKSLVAFFEQAGFSIVSFFPNCAAGCPHRPKKGKKQKASPKEK